MTTQAPVSKLMAKDLRYSRRKLTDRLAMLIVTLCAAIAGGMLIVILSYIFIKGFSSLSWDFLTNDPRPSGVTGGGIFNALAGSGIIVGMAALIAMPIGIGAAIFLNEFDDPWIGRPVRFVADVMTSVPSIVVGLAVYTLIVAPTHHFSAWAGAVAYAFIMIPIVVITAQEALRLVPQTYREAALALGVPRWRVILRVVLPVSKRALLTGVILAVARALGETAPMLFTSLGNNFTSFNIDQPMSTVPVVIYRYASSPYSDLNDQAWAAAFILVVIILLVSILTRFVLRSKHDDR